MAAEITTHTTRARKAGNGKILVSGTQSFIPGKEGPKRIYGDHGVLFTSEKYIAEQPQTVKSVLAALVRANDFIEHDRQQDMHLVVCQTVGAATGERPKRMEHGSS